MHRNMIALMHQGEQFYREDGSIFVASIINSTRATYSLAGRACYFEGAIVRGTHAGEYLTRKLDDSRFLINTVHPQPKSPGVDYIFMAQCNTLAALARPKNVGTGSNRKTAFEVYAENVLIFKDTTTRSLKAQNDGLVSQDITIIHIPARYGIKKLDRVYIVREGVPLDSEDGEYYQVDSINTALTPLFDYVDFSGVTVQQLSNDNRERDIFKPDYGGGDTGGIEPTDPDDGYW